MERGKRTAEREEGEGRDFSMMGTLWGRRLFRIYWTEARTARWAASGGLEFPVFRKREEERLEMRYGLWVAGYDDRRGTTVHSRNAWRQGSKAWLGAECRVAQREKLQ